MYDTKEEILALGNMDPELKVILDAHPPPKIENYDVMAFRQMFAQRTEAAKAQLGLPPEGVKRSEIEYTTSDGHKNRALLFQPSTPPKEGSPLVVMIHGGGFCLGEPEGEEQGCRNFTSAFGAVCVSISYRLAPEHVFPAAAKDSWDALRWAAKNASSWGADPHKGFIVGGTSAGGNLTSVVTLMARDEKLSPPLTGQYLIVPAVCPKEKMPEKYKKYALSYEQNKDAVGLGQREIDMFEKNYKNDPDDAIWYSTLLNPKGHADQPRTYFQIDGLDPLRDEGLIYERILREEHGIPTKLDVYPGVPHGHWAFFPMLKQSDKFREDQVKGMAWLLERPADMDDVELDAKVATA